MNPAMIFQMKKHWETFVANHPKFPLFLRAAKDNGISVGSIIDVHLCYGILGSKYRQQTQHRVVWEDL